MDFNSEIHVEFNNMEQFVCPFLMETSRKHNKKRTMLGKYEFNKYERTICLPMLLVQ